jgi:peptidoglycan hydrolase-like protein with peptidoglycan-binding domain
MGHNCGKTDGEAGSKTLSSIASFQETHKLGKGYLGGEDWYYLIK